MASPAATAAALKRDRAKSLEFIASIVSTLDDIDSRLTYIETMLTAICDKLEIEIEEPVELTQEEKDSAFDEIKAAGEKWTSDQPVDELEPDVSLAQG